MIIKIYWFIVYLEEIFNPILALISKTRSGRGVLSKFFWGGRGGGWGGVSSEGCLKWGGGGGVIKGSFQKHLKTGGG